MSNIVGSANCADIVYFLNKFKTVLPEQLFLLGTQFREVWPDSSNFERERPNLTHWKMLVKEKKQESGFQKADVLFR